MVSDCGRINHFIAHGAWRRSFDCMIETPYHTGKLLLINKPFGWTSFDLVNKVRFALEKKFRLKRMSLKVGHAGTLDPLATGLMLICTGKICFVIY